MVHKAELLQQIHLTSVYSYSLNTNTKKTKKKQLPVISDHRRFLKLTQQHNKTSSLCALKGAGVRTDPWLPSQLPEIPPAPSAHAALLPAAFVG